MNKTLKININKSKKSKKTNLIDKDVKLNIFSTNFHYYEDNDNNIKLLLHKLSNSLKDNQWLKVSHDNSNNFNYTRSLNCGNDNVNNNSYYKPNGSWYSKGEWLFHDINGGLEYLSNSYISLVEVDYSKIYKITNNKPNNYKLLPSYYKALNKFIARYNKIYKHKNFNIMMIKWMPICKKYNGIAIYPIPPHSYLRQYIKTEKTLHFLESWDVSSLCLWDMSSIIKHQNLGKFKHIDNLISKITEINEIK